MVRRTPARRRGVLLLIVLSLLVLFVLIGLTFIVAAGQFKGNASSAARADLTGMPGPKLCDASLYQVLRGTKNPHSSVQGHSLLEDLYGRDYFVGRVRRHYRRRERQHPGFQTIVGLPIRSGMAAHPPELDEQFRDRYYGGCVLTFISGPAAGKSTRIVAHGHLRWVIGGWGNIAFERVTGLDEGELQGHLFIVNGRPFNGTGAGLSAPPFVSEAQATWKLDNSVAFNQQFPIALLPHYSAYGPHNPEFQATVGQTKGLAEIAHGGLDESWDAVDYQNLFLAKVPARAWAHVKESSDRAFLRNTGGIIPSFHRPYLLRHLANPAYGLSEQVIRRGTTARDRVFRRAFLFRPDATDHPSFSGSNPDYDPLDGPWDVDNDGDGLADSIWVDFGHDPVAGPDGRLFKPLVAPLIIDLDGKLNLNAVGSVGHESVAVDVNAGHSAAGADPTIAQAGTGLGYGPADINLAALLPSEYRRLLRSRYRGSGEPRDTATPGEGPHVDDDLILSQQGLGNAPLLDRYYTADQNALLPGEQNSLFTGFGSPPDFNATSVPYIDPTGNMLWAGAGRVNDQRDDPYEADLLLRAPRDNLFDLADLEALLRFDDHRTPSRLRNYSISSLGGIESGLRRLFTTHSYHIPAPPSLNAGRWRHGDSTAGGEGLCRSICAMFAAKSRRALLKKFPAQDPEHREDLAWANATRLAPEELAQGQRLDINRMLEANVPPGMSSLAGERYVKGEQSKLHRKATLARDLYHLLMLFADEDFELPGPGLTAMGKRELHARRLAQWAINVVDFGDADSVMTPFEYFVDPFNSAGVRSGPHPYDRRVIWGCEHPEVLLTETLAFHDRRVRDLPSGDGLRRDGQREKDLHLDQPVPPQGSLFVELYCVRGGPPAGSGPPRSVSSRGPEDLYHIEGNETAYLPSLDLGRIAPGGTPVWRLAVSEPHAEDSPQQRRVASPDKTSFEPSGLRKNLNLLPDGMETPKRLELTRFAFFTNRSKLPADAVLPPEVTPRNSYWRQGLEPAIVEPGRYVVVGPRLVTNVGLTTQHWTDGTKTETVDEAENGTTSPQKIDLRFLNAADPDAQHKNLNLADPLLRPTKPRTVTVIARTESGRAGVSISEPTDGSSYYPDPDPATGRYEIPFDKPFDGQPPDPGNPEPDREQAPLALSDADLNTGLSNVPTGTLSDHRTVFLQRLANPNVPWNEEDNPYLTVDWMPIDLTIFNSLDEDRAGTKAPPGEPFDPQDPQPGGPLNRLASREKAGQELNIFSARTEQGASSAPADPIDTLNLAESVGINVPHTLGWLNRAFDVFDGMRDGKGHYIAPGSEQSGRYDEAPNSRATSATFPTLVWNNRPYISEYELMLVPACSQARLTHEFTTSRPTARITGPAERDEQNQAQNQDAYLGAFGHLLNFFHSTQGKIGESGLSANSFRLFDFVTVPSRFRGTRHRHYRGRGGTQIYLGEQTFSRFREPGRVNLNTACDPRILGALGIGDRMEEFERHMAGNLPAFDDDGTPRVPTGRYPAEYPNPLRAGVSADLMPPIPGLENNLAVDATLLRSSVDIPGQPLLAKYRDPRMTGADFGPPYQNRKNNAYFRYRDIQKLANLVTSQSNVYAVWLTIGFFEIEPNYAADDTTFQTPYYIDDAHPDGYRFGAEMGSDLGDVKRHRAFYIIDRSIPVAFEPGVNHNVDKAVLVRRYLD